MKHGGVTMPTRLKTAIVLLGIIAFLLGCGGGTNSSPPPSPLRSPPATPTLLRTLYRVLVNGSDRMTTIGPNERTIYPLEGQVYYVPDQSASGRTALNRLINSDLTDHADAIGSLSGYSQDMVLGFPWTSASVSGVVPLLESFDSSTGDHALQAPSESLPGYSPQPLAAYGYPRYGNAAEVLLTLSTGGVTVQSNAVAGGALWRWYWNGTQFVNHFDYGREIQGAFFFKSDQLNPTEAGDEFTSPYSLDQ